MTMPAVSRKPSPWMPETTADKMTARMRILVMGSLYFSRYCFHIGSRVGGVSSFDPKRALRDATSLSSTPFVPNCCTASEKLIMFSGTVPSSQQLVFPVQLSVIGFVVSGPDTRHFPAAAGKVLAIFRGILPASRQSMAGVAAKNPGEFFSGELLAGCCAGRA